MRHVFIIGFILLFAGCGGSGGDGKHIQALNPVKGMVLRGKVPVNGGVLTWTPQTPMPDAVVQAEVGPDGRFEAFTIDTKSRDAKRTPGAPAGTYRVVYLPPNPEQKPEILPLEALHPVVVEAKANDLTIEVQR